MGDGIGARMGGSGQAGDERLLYNESMVVRLERNNITLPIERIEAFCEKHHIRKMAIFGSMLRNDFDDDSDIDVLVEFDPAHIPGLAFFGMGDELAQILGRRVDFLTEGFLSESYREDVLSQAAVIYERA